MPLAYDRFLSSVSKERPRAVIRGLLPLENTPGVISLLAGKPNPDGFPFESITVRLKPSAVMSADPATGEPVTLTISGKDLEEVLQYGATSGCKSFEDVLVDIVGRMHARHRGSGPGGDFGMAIGTGSQDLLIKALTSLFDPDDTMLVESPTYPGMVPEMVAHNVNMVPVDSDSDGMSAESLGALLENWHTAEVTRALKFPKAVYTVPTGANPAGTTASADRKRAVLAQARKHGLLIFEDDPYYYLTFNEEEDGTRTPSYFALECEDAERWGYGYVMRFESMSKIMSAGMRLGFLVGPKPLVDAVNSTTASQNLHASLPPQAMAAALLQHWGTDGFLRHVRQVSDMYKARRDAFEKEAVAHLGTGTDGTQTPVATWVTPVAGMFHWFKLRLPPSEDAPDGDSYEVIATKAFKAGVLAVPGVAFSPVSEKSAYVRTSFSILPLDQVGEAFRRLRSAVEETWKEAGYDGVPAAP
ncbi:tryptophan transaminase [Malassezia sp. CBS 17886]|nr:tryptophan transaminase [Malassezia sp. CBS 17886]